MREVQITAFEAFDGKQFETAAKCKEYEGLSLFKRLAGWTETEALNALDRTDKDRAWALEEAGNLVREIRLKAGERLRKRAEKPNGSDDEEKADQKHRAQMADLSADDDERNAALKGAAT